jgi:hypothetical protein
MKITLTLNSDEVTITREIDYHIPEGDTYNPITLSDALCFEIPHLVRQLLTQEDAQ